MNSTMTTIGGVLTALGVIVGGFVTIYGDVAGLEDAVKKIEKVTQSSDELVEKVHNNAVSNADRIGRVEGSNEALEKEIRELREDLREARQAIKDQQRYVDDAVRRVIQDGKNPLSAY